MRHGDKVNNLGRTASHRRALLANLAISLIEHKRITTTLAKAKALRVYIEPLEPSPELYVIGAGHVGSCLVNMAHEAGFQVHVVDDREKFANRDRFPQAAEVVTEDSPAWLARTALPPHAYTVIVTRGHTNDLDALRALAPRELRYLGLIGSRAKVARITDQLLSEGMNPALLTQVHAPIGLDIGAVTPQEIAVSILAELIAVKHGKVKSRNAAELSMKWSKVKVS